MAASNIIELGYNYDELTAETKLVVTQLQSVLDVANQLQKTDFRVNGGGLKTFNDDLKAQSTLLNDLAAKQQNVTKAIAEKTRTEAQAEAQAKRTAAAARAEAKINADAINDYKQLSLAYRDAAERAKNYQIQLGASHPIAIQATADAKAQGDYLKQLDASVGQYNRNVGNYASAFQGYANTLRGLRGPTKLLGEALGVGAAQADQFRIVIEHSLQGIAAYFRGKESKAAADAAAATASAAETTAVTAETVAESANTTVTSANTVATELNTEVTVGAAVATESVAVATTTASTAMKVFRVALASTGIGLLVAAIGYLVFQLYEQSKASKLAAENQKILDDIAFEGNANAGKKIEQLKLEYEATQSLLEPMDKRLKAAQELQKTYPETFKNFTTEQILLGEAKKGYDELTKSIVLAARAEAAKNKLGELEGQRLNINDTRTKINIATTNEAAKAQKILNDERAKGEKRISDIQITRGDAAQIELGEIARRKKLALQEQDIQEKNLDAQEKAIIDFVGQKNLLDVAIADGDKKNKG